jgi:hypothetical protein
MRFFSTFRNEEPRSKEKRSTLSFINPIFLFAASAALLPVIYHLIRKMRARKVKFSSLLFLKATPKEMIRKRRLQDLILLVVRCCILGLLALAFARPFIPEEAIPLISREENRSTVILLDNSYSMQFADLFDRARTEALNRLENAPAADEFAVVVFSDRAEQLSELSNDRALHTNVVRNSAGFSNRSTDFYSAFKLAEEILKNARHESRQIVLISDLQSNGWSAQFENWDIDQSIDFIPVKIAQEDMANSFIEEFDLKYKRLGDAAAAQYGIQLNSQVTPGENTEVTLRINDREIDRKKSEAARSNQVFFQQTDLREGNYQGHVLLSEDNLPIDNVHYFSFAVEARSSILVVDGSKPSSRSNAFYLKNCFDMGRQSIYEFAAGGKNRITSGGLMSHDVIFITNIKALSRREVGRVRSYVENGGTLIVSFGDRVSVREFSRSLVDLGVGGIRDKVLARKVQPSNAIIGEIDLKHPIFSVFAKSGAGDILKPKFREYVKILPDSNAVILGKYDTGDPFLIERWFGNGKVLVLTSTLNTEWGDFPVNEIYLPFVYQLVKYAVTSAERVNAFKVGDAVALHGDSGDEWEVKAPENKIYKVGIDESGYGYFRETEVPGNYLAALAGEQFHFSVNVDTRESDLTSRDPEEVYAAVTRSMNQADNEIARASLSNIDEEEKRQKLWRYVLFLIVVLFLFETFFANRRILNREGAKGAKG